MLRAGALLLLLAAALPAALAQTTTKIGVVNIAPFATKGADGKLTGRCAGGLVEGSRVPVAHVCAWPCCNLLPASSLSP